MKPGHWQAVLIALLGGMLCVFISDSAFAFPTYEDCKECHGGFRDGSYTSLNDGSNWGDNLMDAHAGFVGDECNACHKSGGRKEVFLNFSNDGSLSKSCVGCHGRDEDVNSSCTGLNGSLGGVEEQCGSGAGLRKIHNAHPQGGNCSDCHTDPTPAGEHIAPYNYGRTGVVIQDSCDGDGTESRFGSTGLDNDGDGQRDGNDSDCQSNSPPTQPGALSASAVTTDSATVSWGASTDPDDDAITYQMDYRHTGQVAWTNGGSTAGTSQPLAGLDPDQSYDVRVTPNDGTEDGPERTTLDLFQTDVDVDLIYRDGFESN
jgi:hypothetical protein